MAHVQLRTAVITILIWLSSALLYKNENSSDLKFEKLKTQFLKLRHGRPSSHDISHELRQISGFSVPRNSLGFDNEQTDVEKHKRQMLSPKQPHGDSSHAMFQQTTKHFVSESSQSLIKSLCNVNGKTKVCYVHGQSICRCTGQLADCSGKRYVPNIAYAPKLPLEIKCLLFRYNNVAYLDDSFFANVSDYRVIDFSSNKLRTISEKTFDRFNGRLEYLILNSNSLTYGNIRNVFKFPPSKRLDLVDFGLSKSIPKGFFEPFANIHMSELCLDLNYMQQLDLREFSVLKNLKYLSVENCSIFEIKSAIMPSLEFLNMQNNPILTFPTTCEDSSSDIQLVSNNDQVEDTLSMFPKLKSLNIGNTKIQTFPPYTELCLPKMEILVMTLSNISIFRSNSLKSLTSLRVLILDHMKSNISVIESNAFSSQTITSLHLTKNHIPFNSKNVSDKMFQDCPFLEVLHLDHNDFSNFSEKSYVHLFTNLSSLRYLYMGSSQMTFIPSKSFSQLTEVKKIFLYLNKIKSIPPAAFDQMSSLQYLFLDENQITAINNQAFSTKTIQRLIKIDLSKNNFQCNCDLLWFQLWLKNAGSTQFYFFPNGYACADRPGTMVTDFILSKQACLYSRKTYILFTVLLSIMIVLFVVSTIIYRYRWHIRLTLYEWRSSPSQYHIERQDMVDDITHDVFIVYCNDDSPWVLDELLPRVESEWGLRAFVHERDFIAGRLIIDNTITAMNTCRHILVVLSTRFADSSWCNFELQLCQSHVIDHDLPSLLVVALEPIEPYQMSTIVGALRGSTTFLEWPEDSEDQRHEDLFWRKLERCVRRMKDGSNRTRRGQPIH